MGMNASALLAYGYDLGNTLTELAEESVRPDWMPNGDSDSAIDYALRALFAAAGGKRAPDDYLHEIDVYAQCGVMLATYGSVDDPRTRVILAVRAFEADMNGPKPVDLRRSGAADWQLTWALRVLGIEAPQPRPRWILAASHG